LPSDTLVCEGASFQFAAQDPVAEYTWSAPVAEQQQHYSRPSLLIEKPVTLTVTATRCTVTVEKSVNIATMHLATPEIKEQNGQLLVDGSHGINYQWMQNDQPLNSVENVLAPTAAGRYSVIASNTAGCSVRSANYFYLPAGGSVLGSNIRIKLAPNPSNGNFKVLVAGLPARPITIKIVNALGITVYTGRITDYTKDIHLNAAAAGTYFAEFVADGQKVNIPLVIY